MTAHDCTMPSGSRECNYRDNMRALHDQTARTRRPFGAPRVPARLYEPTRDKPFQRATNRPDFAFVTATYNSTDDGYDFAGAYKHTQVDIGADAQRSP